MIRYMKIGMLIKYVTQTHNRYVKMYVMEAYKTGIQYRYVRGMCCGMSCRYSREVPDIGT